MHSHIGAGFGRHEQPKILLCILQDPFEFLLQHRQPMSHQVNILQHDPVAFLRRDLQFILRDDFLSLAERDVVELARLRGVAELLSQRFHFLERVDARR